MKLAQNLATETTEDTEKNHALMRRYLCLCVLCDKE